MKQTDYRKLRGSTVVEITLVFLTTLIILAGIIEGARYMFIRATMMYGAQRAAELASRIANFGDDPYTLATSDAAWSDYHRARARIITTALQIPKLILGASTDNSENKLISFAFSDGATTGSHPLRARYADISADVAIVRPGERYTSAYDGYVLNHPTAPAPYSSVAYESNGLATHPIVVEMRALYTPLLPFSFLKQKVIKVRALSFREIPYQSAVSSAVAMLPPGVIDYPTTTLPDPSSSGPAAETTTTTTLPSCSVALACPVGSIGVRALWDTGTSSCQCACKVGFVGGSAPSWLCYPGVE